MTQQLLRSFKFALTVTAFFLGLFLFRNIFWLALDDGLFGRSQPGTWFSVSGMMGAIAFCLSLTWPVLQKVRGNLK